MYNKTKRGLELAGAIIAICLGAVEIIFGFISIIQIIGVMDSYGASSGELVILLIASIADVAIGIVMICMGAPLCRYPKKINGEWEKHNGKKITAKK